jgi:M3 family oligoendopeptidase
MIAFRDYPYRRPDLEKAKEELAGLADIIRKAPDAAAQKEAFLSCGAFCEKLDSASVIASIRHTADTADPFYAGEIEYYDRMGPLIEDRRLEVYKAMLRSPFRQELEAQLGPLLFEKMETEVKGSDPAILELMQKENALETEYQRLYASARIPFDGKELTIPQLTYYKQSRDRAVRRAAFCAEGEFFDAHREEFDRLFDELVKNRTAQARALGYESFTPLGYIRMKRCGYGPAEVERYRAQTAEEIVPLIARVKEIQKRRIGTEALCLWDDSFYFPDGNAMPSGSAEEILSAGRRMYRELSPETAEFIDFMFERELFDLLSRPGKAPGGYCTYIPDFKSPFIFSNFNGTSGDVDVLTHEAGHAFAAYRAAKQKLIPEYSGASMEICEIHSMSMEFLTGGFRGLFFGRDAAKYELSHAESALSFLPYGCMVDEFQHIVYADPGLAPEQRNLAWLELERKYRPYLDFGDLPFYSRGAGWQRQLHLYECPFYYIDYCLAQTVAFQFWEAWLKCPADGWQRYLTLVDLAGTKSFPGLVQSAGLKSPFEPGCLKALSRFLEGWIRENQL